MRPHVMFSVPSEWKQRPHVIFSFPSEGKGDREERAVDEVESMIKNPYFRLVSRLHFVQPPASPQTNLARFFSLSPSFSSPAASILPF